MRPLRKALAVELVILRKLVVLGEVDGHDLGCHGQLSDVAASTPQGGDSKVAKLYLNALELRPDRRQSLCQTAERDGAETGPVHVATNGGQLVFRDLDL